MKEVYIVVIEGIIDTIKKLKTLPINKTTYIK